MGAISQNIFSNAPPEVRIITILFQIILKFLWHPISHTRSLVQINTWHHFNNGHIYVRHSASSFRDGDVVVHRVVITSWIECRPHHGNCRKHYLTIYALYHWLLSQWSKNDGCWWHDAYLVPWTLQTRRWLWVASASNRRHKLNLCDTDLTH